MMREALLVLTAFVLMEPLTYLAHRHIFHGFGYGIHKSHHAKRTGVLEANDFYPLCSALITMSLIATGVFWKPASFLIPVGFGMTAYGALYFFIHDLVIHKRVQASGKFAPFFHWHGAAHRIHHLRGGEPYGLLWFNLPGSPFGRTKRKTPAAA